MLQRKTTSQLRYRAGRAKIAAGLAWPTRTPARRLPAMLPVILRRLLILLLLLAPTPPALAEPVQSIEPPPPGLARLYVYRQHDLLLVTLEPHVIVNGLSLGTIAMGEAFFRDARPGRYEIHLSSDPWHVVELQLGPGDTAFVRATLRVGLGTVRLSAEHMGRATAAHEIKLLNQKSEVAEPPPPDR